MDEQPEVSLFDPSNLYDVIFYNGAITIPGYEFLCEITETNKRHKKALLVIETPGGDPNAGFRIARALHHHYDTFDVFIPRYCKSAGTLICTGASTIFMDDRSELGPLDIQVKKDDEIIGRSSGLDIVQAMNNLQSHSLNTLREVLLELTAKAALSTKVASEIACKLTTGIYEPIYAQIDPIKIAEMHRATAIAFAYGQRLNEKSMNLFDGGLANLVLSYPSHGFVIDRKEARTMFKRVLDAKTEMHKLLKKCFDHFGSTAEHDPMVHIFSIEDLFTKEGESNEPQGTEADARGDDSNEHQVNANGQNHTRSVEASDEHTDDSTASNDAIAGNA